MAKGWILGLAGAVALAALGAAGWVWRGRQERRAVLAAFGRYERALKQQDLEALRGSMVKAKRGELAGPEAAAQLALAAALRPADYGLSTVTVGWREARLNLSAGEMKGVAELVKEDGAWRLVKESWSLSIAGAPDLPPASLPRKVKALLDRMAGPDAQDGGQAWMELGGGYTNPDTFFEDVRGAFDDPRPIAFRVEWTSTESGGQRYSGYTTKLEPIASGPSEARTIGEVLRMDMYRMEGAGLGASPKPFKPWWEAYRKARGLGPEPATAADPPQGTVTLSLGDGTPAPAQATPLTGELAPEFRDPRIPAKGEAWGTLDDKPVRFLLATGFWSDTRFDDPRKGILDFRVPGATRTGNSRRIRLVLDATRTGAHDLGNGEAKVEFIEDGGQVFPPRAGGVLRLASAYGDDKLEGEIPELLIHSAGISHRLVLRFVVEGRLTRQN
jgi:hypothetical protein